MGIDPDRLRSWNSPTALANIVSGAVFAAALALLLPEAALSQAPQKSSLNEKSGRADSGTKLRIRVTAGEKDEPVENASVYVKFEQERKLARDKKIEMNLKTNHEGVAVSPGIPHGKVLVQVVAPGWKTFGQWYEMDKDEVTLNIRLQKPPHWY